MNMNLLWDQFLKENVFYLTESSCGSIETNFVPPSETQLNHQLSLFLSKFLLIPIKFFHNFQNNNTNPS